MNQNLATNIRAHREVLSWTQEQLADAAEINVRTVQRVEDGRGVSAETLQAIAGAMNVSLDVLRTDPRTTDHDAALAKLRALSPQEVENAMGEHKARFAVVAVHPIESSSDFTIVEQTEAFLLHCVPTDDDIRDRSAELDASCRELADALGVTDPVSKRQLEKNAFAKVAELARLGCCVSAGIRHQSMRIGASRPPIPFRTLYVVVERAATAKRWIMVPRDETPTFA